MRKHFVALFLIFLILILQGCRVGQWGVVLWSSDTVSLQTGSIVKIRSKIAKKDIYRVEDKFHRVLEVDTWRIKSFKTRGQAKKYASKYAFYINNYVEGQLDGLPMRDSTSISANIVYKVANDEILKVIGRSKERVEIGPYKGYWYNLLSHDGTEGWVYGRFLKLFIQSSTGEAIYEDNQFLGNSLLERFFDPSIIWLPIYFRDMINRKQINLDLFNAEYGLFVNDIKKSIKIKLPNYEESVTYTQITPVGGDNYHFDGTNFSFSLGQRETVVRYVRNDKKVKEVFFAIEKDKGLLSFINEESQRRSQKYNQLKQLVTKNGSYGSITFLPNGNFKLANFASMINAGVVLSSSGSSGHIEMDVFLNGDLATKYNGGFTMVFLQDASKISFLYRFISGGIELTHIEDLPKDKTLNDDTIFSKQEVMVFS